MLREMNRIRHCLTVCAVLLATLGCGTDEPPPAVDSAPFEGVQLKIAVPAEYDLKTRWQIELDEWSARTGARYELQEYDSTGHDSTKPSALDEAALLLLPLTEAATRKFAPIADDLQSSENVHFIDLFEGLRTGPASVSGQPALLPIASPVLVYAYRHDLFTEAKLTPPTTWEEHLKLLETLDGKGLAAVAPWGDDFRVTMFLARAVSSAKHPHQYSLFFDVSTGEPLIDGPGFVRALDELRPALKLMQKHHDVTSLSPAECRKLLLSGKAAVAMTLVDPIGEADVERLESSQFRFARIPGSPTAFNGSTNEWESIRDEPVNYCTLTAFDGLVAGVSADASELEQRAAWELLAQLTVESRKLMQVFPARARSLCRESQLAVPSAFVSEQFSAAEAEQAAQVLAASLRGPQLVADLPVVGRKRFRAALSQGIGRFLNEEVSAEETLKQVAAEWRSIASEIGDKTVLNSYRTSIGLSPK